jgi:hypothetical protein
VKMKVSAEMWAHRMRFREIIMMLALLFFVGFVARMQWQRSAVAPLVVDNRQLDLGEVWERSDLIRRLTVTNVGTREIVVHDFEKSCGCMSVRPVQFTIPPHGKQDLELTLNLTTSHPERAALATRPLTVRLIPIVDGGGRTRPPIWTIHGTIKNPFCATPLAFMFAGADGLVSGGPHRSKSVVLSLNYPGLELRASCAEDKGSVRLTPMGNDRKRYLLTYTPSPDLPPGPLNFAVAIDVASDSGEALTRYEVPVRGEVEWDVEWLPGFLHLGTCPVGKSAEAVVKVRSRKQCPIRVFARSGTNAGLEVTRISEESAAEEHQFRVKLTAALLGEHQVDLTFEVARSNGNVQRLVLPVAYCGLAPGVGQ